MQASGLLPYQLCGHVREKSNMADNIARVLVVSCSSFLSPKDIISGKK